MPRFFIDGTADGRAYIAGADALHIAKALRMRPGEALTLCDGKGTDFDGVLETVTDRQVTVRITASRPSQAEPTLAVTLYQGLPKGDKMDWIIQKAVELGAYRVVPVSMKRSVVKLDAKKADAKRKRWNAVSESAAKQSKRSLIPEVAPLMTYKEAVKEAAGYDMVLLPYESADGIRKTRELLASVKPGTDIAVFIGPEGGFEDEEVELARENGAEIVTLGKRILRTETAGLCMLSALMLQLEV